VFTPAYANAYRDAALTIRRASGKCWTAFLPHRDVSTTLTISAVVHLLVLFGIGAAIYEDGEDAEDIPELSVQLETRDSPNSDEFTEAALPRRLFRFIPVLNRMSPTVERVPAPEVLHA